MENKDSEINTTKIEINEDILLGTKCCDNNKSCLNGNLNNCCKVIECINNHVYFVKDKDIEHCYYRHKYGYSSFCTCPTRKGIYNKYKQ